MNCAVCFSLGAEEVKGQKLGTNQRMAKFIQIHDLQRSATTTSCQFCQLLWASLRLRKKDLCEPGGKDVSGLLQMRFAPGTPLQIFVSGWGQDNIALELFSRRG